MKHLSILFITGIVTIASTFVQAQDLKVPEPEFVNSYYIMTSDSTYETLPKEVGTIKKHESRFSKLAQIANVASDISGATAILGAATGSFGAVVGGVEAMGAASSIGNLADAASILTSANGMDIVFDGGNSSYTLNPSGQVNIIVKSGDNSVDPVEIYRIVRLKGKKKERRIQWLQFNPSLLGTDELEKKGFLSFTGHKYGNESYILSIPENQLKAGEYAIFFLNIGTGAQLPVATFSIK